MLKLVIMIASGSLLVWCGLVILFWLFILWASYLLLLIWFDWLPVFICLNFIKVIVAFIWLTYLFSSVYLLASFSISHTKLFHRLACIYAACKIEEYYVSAEELSKSVVLQDHQMILNYEMIVYQVCTCLK